MAEYDIRFILPATPTKSKYLQRLNDMKKYGLVNAGEYKVQVVLLVEEGYDTPAELLKGWHPGIDATYVSIPYMNVAHKFAWFYLWSLPESCDVSKWTVRVDDDSATDISALMREIEELDPSDPYHFIARECHAMWDLQPEFMPMLQRYGFTRAMMYKWRHSWEVSVDSMEAITRLTHNCNARDMCKEILKTSQDGTWWADQHYCYMLRLCKVHPHIVRYLSKSPCVRDFTFTGGELVHIHYVAHDINHQTWATPRAGMWTEFTASMEKVYAGN